MGQTIKGAVSTDTAKYSYLGGSALDVTDYSKVDSADIIFDFSSAAGNESLLKLLSGRSAKSYAVLVGSTGLPVGRVEQWKVFAQQRNLKLLIAPNTSLGVLIMAKAAMMIAPIATRHGFDMALIETHHNRKLDAPSGTAKFLGESICACVPGFSMANDSHGSRQPNRLSMHSIRAGGVYGEHQLRLISETEEIELSHRALSRDLFASGALVMAEWLLKRDPGVYALHDIELSDLV
jgi:4-hydroxy-tetrahydrodipicolinate reductase